MTVKYIGNAPHRRTRNQNGPIPTYTADFITGGGGALPPGVTFSRGSTAKYYNQQGYLVSNENLALYSQAFTNAAWLYSAYGTLVDNAGVAPDGTNTATLITATNTGTNNYWAQQTIALNPGVYVVSVYARSPNAVGKNFAPWLWANSTGTLVGGGNGAPTSWYPITSTWARYSFTANVATAGNFALRFDTSQGNAAIGDQFYVWGYQIQSGAYPTQYNATTSAAVYGPRFDYDPSNLVQQNLEPYTYSIGTNHTVIDGSLLYSPTIQAPDGTYGTVWKFAEDTATTAHILNGLFVPVAGSTYNVSIYVKSAGNSRQVSMLGFGISSQGYAVVCNPDDGTTVGTWPPAGGSFTPVGNGWYRLQLTITSSNNLQIQLYLYNGASNTYTSDGSSGVYVWGVQVSSATTYTSFLANATAGPLTICAPKGLLIEQSSTNIATYSSDFTQSAWSNLNVTVTANATTSPEGLGTAQSVIATTTSGQHYIDNIANLAAGTTYTISAYVKILGTAYPLIGIGCAYNSGGSNFNMQTGVIQGSSFGTATIQSAGQGWYRCSVTVTPASNTNAFIQINGLLTSFAGDGASGAYVWGFQVEALAFPTSYIPTTSAAVTRSAEVVTSSSIPWFNSAAGTMIVQADTVNNAASNFPGIIGVDDTTSANRIGLFVVAGASPYGASREDISSVAYQTGSGTFTPYAAMKTGTTYNGTAITSCTNGSSVASVAGAVLPTLTRLTVGQAIGSTLNGHVRSFSYFNYAVSTTQLQALTT